MQFDDRLATVLRMQAGSERAANTQFRQLLDLVGSVPNGANDTQLEAAYERLSQLSSALPAEQRAAMIREPGLRLRNPGFIAFLSSQEMPVARAAMAAARLTGPQWAALLPALPIPVRALLRERRDLPDSTNHLLARLGVRDLVLPEPGPASHPAEPISAAVSPPVEPEFVTINAVDEATEVEIREDLSGAIDDLDLDDILDLDPALQIETDGDDGREGIGALVRRIEAFRRAREEAAAPLRGTDAPRLPLGEYGDDAPAILAAIDFTTDAEGRIDWAGGIAAPMTVGIALLSGQENAPARADAAMIAAMRRHQPVRSARLELDGAPAIAGEWRVDAAPHFALGGRFNGYRGRMRRPAQSLIKPANTVEDTDSPADRMRQVIHELRTPVNAIQGFAEIIQQQLFGPTPNEYRALAASIAGDAARMLAGFEELDRLVKLETGALELDRGTSDFNAIVAATVAQLDTALRPRNAGLELAAIAPPCPVPLARPDAELLAWRILATIAGAVSPGEALQIVLAHDSRHAALEIDLPAALADREDIFESAVSAKAQAMTAGMFGAGFTLRLARAEAVAAGGDLRREGDALELVLPVTSVKAIDINNNDIDTGS